MTDTRVLSGRYRITRHLARGGMGDVFEADDTLLGRRVAVKVLHEQFARDEAFVSRFRREAQAAANLNHPNIVAIYDWGQYESTYYMVMELIDGRSLREIRRSEGALLPRRAAEIAAETAAALTVAHESGVFHRDVKPGNIMLTPGGSVKVTDFGIARALDDSEELTRTGAVIGTATYFSPEQAQGLPADGRSDVYSLGVVLYELLCGRPPFLGDSPVAVAYQHVSEWAAPVSTYNPDVPAELEAIVDRAMEKDPAARYQSAAEMRGDLLRYLRGDLAASPPPSEGATRVIGAPLPPATVPPDETARHVASAPSEERRSTTSYVLGILALLLLLGAGVFILWSLLFGGDPAAALVTIPDLANQSQAEAIDELQELGLRVQLRPETSEEIAEGFVIGTEPQAGSQVEEGSLVTIVVSAGPDLFPVPRLEGLPEAEARELIEQQGFVVGDVASQFTDEVDEGIVISQDPDAGEEVAPGTAVDLVVSGGPFALTVPDVAGFTREDAVAELEAAGFGVTVEDEFSDDVVEGFAIRTEPGAGQLVDRENPVVTLFVSSGPEPFPLPDFVGDTVQEAQQQAATLGLELIVDDQVVEVTLASGLDGRIAAQAPEPGTEMTINDSVRVQLGVIRQVDVPDLLGLTEDDARAELETVGLELEVVGVVDVDPDSGLVDRVAAQDPVAEERVPEGTVVRVQLGTAPPPDTTAP